MLKSASLVTVTRQRNLRIYRLDPHGFDLLRSYLEGFWESALQSYRSEAESIALQENHDE